jgi:hypothetical protein
VGLGVALGIDKPDPVIDLPVVRALADRAIALDESYAKGALHEMFISLDSQPEALGGSVAHAREHFARAVELQKGLSAGPCRSQTFTGSTTCTSGSSLCLWPTWSWGSCTLRWV